MKRTDKVIRVSLKGYNKLRKAFPGKRGESVADYFERLATYLEKCHLCGRHTFDSGFNLDDISVCESCYNHAVFKAIGGGE